MVHWHFVFWTERTPQSLKWSPISLSILILQECSPFLLPLTSWDFLAFLQGYFTHDWFRWLYVHFASWAWEPIVYVHPDNSWSVLFSFIFYACLLLAALLTAYYSGHGEKNKQKRKKKRKKFSCQLYLFCKEFTANTAIHLAVSLDHLSGSMWRRYWTPKLLLVQSLGFTIQYMRFLSSYLIYLTL